MSFESSRLFGALVDRLADIPGVVANAAFDVEGHCLACAVGNAFHNIGAGRLLPALRDLARPRENAPSTDDMQQIEEGVTFVEKRLVRVIVKRGASLAFIALADPETEVDVVSAHLSRALDQAARAGRPVSNNPAAPSIAPGLQAKSGFYPRFDDSPASPRKSSMPPAGRTIDPAVIERLEALAVECLGFAGDEAIARIKTSLMTFGNVVPRARWMELVGRLASEVDDDDVRDDFVQRALALPVIDKPAEGLDNLSPIARMVVERRSG